MLTLKEILLKRRQANESNERNEETLGEATPLPPIADLPSLISFNSSSITGCDIVPTEGMFRDADGSLVHPDYLKLPPGFLDEDPFAHLAIASRKTGHPKTYETLLHLLDDLSERKITLRRDGNRMRISGLATTEDRAHVESNQEALVELFREREDITAAESSR
ncbi:hypothetical protein [Zavarzinella formosa]|uniref:hypothetical protein n=1 Tax=Zavarzinella formosa TaxID=360055 RepID=UPI0002DB6333|nr:hypothetical protein [Zavarzinella formosa]